LIGLPYAVSGAGDLIVLIGIFGLTAVLLSFALRSISAGFESARRNADQLADRNRELRAIRASLERRTARLQMATDVSHGIARVLDPERLFDRIVELIADLFDLHYVGLFMIDPDSDPTDREVVLRAGAGDGRRNFVLAEYRAAMGDDSIVGRCLATVEPQVAYVGPNKEGYHQDEILDGVRTLIALPLQSRGRLLGVLMIQSQEVDAFDDKDLVIMATMADQAAAAIDGTRLRTEAQESASRLESIVRQYVQESWTRLVEEQDTISGYCYDDGRAQPDQDAWLPIMEMAARQQDLVVTQDDGEASVAVPLVQNGVMIGVVGLKRGKGEEWSANEQSMLRAVSEQMTQALENRRLFQVARDRARREYVLRQTTDRVRTQASLDAVLRIAAEEMRRIAGATHVAIRLQTPESGKESVDEPRYS
jgi:GAF domain-containing protein